MKTKSGMMQQNLIILSKFLKIFTFIILINPSPENLRLVKVRGKKVDNQELSFIICLKDLTSKHEGNIIIFTFLMMLITYILILH